METVLKDITSAVSVQLMCSSIKTHPTDPYND